LTEYMTQGEFRKMPHHRENCSPVLRLGLGLVYPELGIFALNAGFRTVDRPNTFLQVLVQFPCEIDRPSEVHSSRFTRNSAPLRPLKVEAGINGLLPTSWVPSIYSVSLLRRLRYALERLRSFAFVSPALVPRSGCRTQNQNV